MSECAGKIAEGVFGESSIKSVDFQMLTKPTSAINKPPRLSSAQVLRDLQNYFRHSTLFAPRLSWQQQQSKQDRSQNHRHAAKNVKIGHGGTLDPLATGVLVVGVGKGTKQMSIFLGCTKTYETVVLFGKSTDTYDVAGKVIGSAAHEHINRALVEEKLAAFRGKIKQVPPIYSALKIDGMKAYDYAKTGKELPRELQARDMEVQECELIEWYEGSTHEYRWPLTQAPAAVTELALDIGAVAHGETQAAEIPPKRKLSRSSDEDYAGQSESKRQKQKTPVDEIPDREDSGTIFTPAGDGENQSPGLPNSPSGLVHKRLSAAEKAKLHTHEIGPLSSEPCPAPAARIRVTASSGFYVRSFAHDLGAACGSLALMATLFRSRQAEFESSSALRYEELEGGEEIWGPTVQKMLDKWNEQHPEKPRIDNRDRPGNEKRKLWEMGRAGPRGTDGRLKINKVRRNPDNRDRLRRNTSSGEE